MIQSVVWGIHGVAGGVLVLVVGLFLALAAWVSIDAATPRSGSRRWLRQWRAVAWGTASFCVLAFAVAGLWGAFHIRTVELTVAHLRFSTTAKGATTYVVDDSDGNGYDTTGAVYDSLQEGDHVR